MRVVRAGLAPRRHHALAAGRFRLVAGEGEEQ
jgi:hypothetical protein